MKLNKQKSSGDSKVELQIAPLIDVVFLLLIYFMVTASLIKKEGDVAFLLPANVSPDKPIELPIEVIIEIAADGLILMEGLSFSAENTQLNDLAGQLRSQKAMARSQGAPFFVSLIPDRNALHKRIVDVMDACAAAKVSSLSFSESL